MDKVVVPMLKKICDQLIRERQQEINRQSQHNTQRRNELSCYSGSIGNIEATLRRNLGYFRSAPFQRIRQDVAAFLQKK